METAVISGRVDAATKEKAARYIKRAGQTPADVIRIVWEGIAATGEVPEDSGKKSQNKNACEDFFAFCDSLPESSVLANLTDEQMRDMLADRYA